MPQPVRLEVNPGQFRFTDNTRVVSNGQANAEAATTWHVEHLLRSLDDLKAYLELPEEVFAYEPDLSNRADAPDGH